MFNSSEKNDKRKEGKFPFPFKHNRLFKSRTLKAYNQIRKKDNDDSKNGVVYSECT